MENNPTQNPKSNFRPKPSLGTFSEFAAYCSPPELMKINAPKSSPPRRGSSREKYSDDSVQFDCKSQQGGFELGNRRGRLKERVSIQDTHHSPKFMKLLLLRLTAES
jgi:hypothetical protein